MLGPAKKLETRAPNTGQSESQSPLCVSTKIKGLTMHSQVRSVAQVFSKLEKIGISLAKA